MKTRWKRWLVVCVAAVILVLGVISCVGWAHWMGRAIVYAPNTDTTIDPAHDLDPQQLRRLGVDRQLRVEVGPPSASLSVWVIEPTTNPGLSRGTILVLHGMRDRKNSMLGVGKMFAAEGYRSVLVDLRGHGRSSGQWLTYGVVESRDMSQVLDTLEREKLLAQPVGVFGGSLGGATGILLAGRDPRVKAVVSIATFASMGDELRYYLGRSAAGWLAGKRQVDEALERAGRIADFDPAEASPLQGIAKTRAEVLLIHGKQDTKIPYAQSEELHRAAPDHSRLVLLDGEDHWTIFNDRTGTISRESVAWFDQHLKEMSPFRVRIRQPAHLFPLREDLPAVEFETARKRFDRLIDTEGATSSNSSALGIALTDNESLWGFGERFDAWDQRGRLVESWTRDMAQGGEHSSYFAVPFLISSAGYGLFVNSTGRVRFDCGVANGRELRIENNDSGLEVYVFRGSPREIVQEYTRLVGRPPLPPEWVFQPWISRNSYMSAAEIDEVITKMEQHGLRAGVVVLEAWAQSLQNFRFEEKRYPAPRAWIESLHLRGYHAVLWETPSIWESASTFPEARRNDFLVRNADGSELVLDWLENARKIDFRQQAAREWWQKMHEPLVEMGVDGFKTDGGERMPDEFFHNLHPYHYQRSVLAAFEAKGKRGVTFARSASAPCAGNSLFWAGDQHSEWGSLRKVVRAGLSAGLSGFPFWGHDIGGYAGTPTPKLYIRWLELGAFSPIMQWHGMTPREPWYFGEDAVRIAKFYFELRWKLQPYLLRTAKQASEHGIPIWRPLALDFTEDAIARGVDDEFLLGDDLLVAPILEERDERNVYLPRGEWIDAWSKQRHVGPKTMSYPAQLSLIPLFVRSGSELMRIFEGLQPPR